MPLLPASTPRATGRPTGLAAWLPAVPAIGFVVAVVAVLAVALVSFQAHRARSDTTEAMAGTLEVIQQVQAVESLVKDAETGQRGFLLTGDESYAQPFEAARAAVPAQLRTLRQLIAGNPRHQSAVDTLERLIAEKMTELGQTVAMRRAGDADAALALVRTDRGKDLMDRIRAVVLDVQTEERAGFVRQRLAWNDAVNASVGVNVGGALLLLALIAGAVVMTSRAHRAREVQTWLRNAQVALSTRLQGDLQLDRLSAEIVDCLAKTMDAQVGALYVTLPDGRLQRTGSFAGNPLDGNDASIAVGQGLLGQAAKEGRQLHVREVPEAHLGQALPVVSSLGRSAPRELLLQPASLDGTVHCVVELGFFRRLDAADKELLQRVAESMAMATRAAQDRMRLETLLLETQAQSEELQTQQEELRVNNEELEEQGRALRESQATLENQQVELEQSNSQLEEQAQQLEAQRDDLAGAQRVLTQKAGDLERANQYKSEFLANMSHELRTPLNSTLILAKLLADNKQENLTQEQVRFAQTIASAGNDLLMLINDILDLSKIESGKVDLTLEDVPVQRVVDALHAGFEPVARQRKLRFAVDIEPGVPQVLFTDEMRIGQILKNLLANAMKFTEAGEVALRVSAVVSGNRGDAAQSDRVRFSVRDTGIGIAEQQRDIIFEAFRQADGSTHRKYGGTGLGLSIARDLAHLLGGTITVQSTVGQGSVFTLELPLRASQTRPPPAPRSTAPSTVQPLPTAPHGSARAPAQDAPHSARYNAPHDAPHDTPRNEPRAVPLIAVPPAADMPLAEPQIVDDRDHLVPGMRVILAIEDDLRFAEILRDLVRELGFQSVLTHTAADGLAAAARYLPSAILLDMNLPDHSGLGVLDHLKRHSQTRHIPVHVVSVADHAQEALQMGAVGYALKPVKRDDLVVALKRLEARFSQGLRRVLVVDDDARQRDSIQHLLASDEVQIVGAENAADALRALQASTFDCMVLDLNLPDLTGYELLEKMASADGMPFPPVIVYTGKSLSNTQEQELRRFSKSIIVKDARSPERLLDEVTLFLHQVESKLPSDRQRMLKAARHRETALEGRRVLVVEDDVRNIFALSAVLEPKGMKVEIARNGIEALAALDRATMPGGEPVHLVLMDIMMPEMDGLTAMREIRKRPELAKLPIIALTAKAMKDDQENCLAAGANDYIAKPLDVERLLSLVRVWMPK